MASDGSGGNSGSWVPSISADGRYVAYWSWATNLLLDNTNGWPQIYVCERASDTTTLVSVTSQGAQVETRYMLAPTISADGRYIAYQSDSGFLVADDDDVFGTHDVFLRDRVAGTTVRVSMASDGSGGNSGSWVPSISADGRYIAYRSHASNLVPGDTNGTWDIFLWDRDTADTLRVSVSSGGAQADNRSDNPSISDDGRYIAYQSRASNLGSNDTNNTWDVFSWDRSTGKTTRVSVTSDGMQGNYESTNPSISANGRYITYQSHASTLIAGDTNGRSDVFMWDRETLITTRISVASDGKQGNNGSSEPSISANGRHVAFESWATNLVPEDGNTVTDVFIRDQDL